MPTPVWTLHKHFPMPDKPSNKLCIMCQCVANLSSGRHGTKELRVHRNMLAGMMERYRYVLHVQHIKTDGK